MALELKVVIAAKDQTKKFRFNQEMSISEVCQEIKEKSGVGGADHGLFAKGDELAGRKTGWMLPDKTLLFYNFKSGDTVTYRKKHRPQKFKLADDTVKTVLIDESASILQLTKVVAEMVGLKNDEEFSLKVEGQPGWLHPTQTLPEQNVDEKSVIVLRKKYFSSDNTVDRSDPVQLHYLYVQCREMVVSGQLPTNYEEACQLAGLQLQIDYGNFVPENHRYGWFQERLEQMASPNHIRMKNFDKDVLHQWKQVTGMQQLNGKYRYVQLVRSLKAFGITCYEVEEKVPNGKGIRKIILGIASERIYRMDLVTKETLSQHSITHLRRFAAGPKTITLDFADYEVDYSTFKTDKGEEILQLISGYIDIYLKKRASVGQVIKDDDAESAEVSELAPVVGFASTTYTSTVGVDSTSLMIGEQGRFSSAGLRPSYNAQMPGSAELQNRQQQRKSVFGSAADKVEGDTQLMRDLDPFLDVLGFADANLPRSALGDEDFKKSLIESMGLAVAQVDEFQGMLKNNPDKTAQGQKLTQLLHSVTDLIRNARMAAAESEEDISLLDGAKSLASAITRMLQTQKMYGPDDPRSIEAVRQVQIARGALMSAIERQQLADAASRQLVESMAGQVNNALQKLSDTAKQPLPDDTVRLAARRDAFDALVDILVPVSASDQGRQQLGAAAQQAAADAALTKRNAAKVQDPAVQLRLNQQSDEVAAAVNNFVAALACTSALDDEDPTVQAEVMVAGLEQIKEARNDKGGLQRGTRDVLVSVNKILRAYVADAERLDADEKNAVLERVAQVTVLLKQEAALSKDSVTKLGDPIAHEALIANGRQLRDGVEQLLNGEGQQTVAAKQLSSAVKHALADTASLATRAREAANNSSDPAAAQKLMNRAQQTTGALSPLMDAIRRSNAQPHDTAALLALANTARKTAPAAAVLVADSAGFVHKVKDIAAKTKLKGESEATYESLENMIRAAEVVSASVGAKAIEEATMRSAAAQAQLEALLLVARDGVLPPPNGSVSDAKSALTMAADSLLKNVLTLREALKLQPAQLKAEVASTTTNLLELTQACGRLAPHQPRALQVSLVDNVRQIVTAVRLEMSTVTTVLANPAAQPNLDTAAGAAKAQIDKLAESVKASALLQGEFEKATKTLAAPPDAPVAVATFAAGVEELDARAKAVAGALARVATDSHGDDEALMGALRSLQSVWRAFRNTAAGVTAVGPPGAKDTLDVALRGVALGAFKMLETVKVGHQTGAHTQEDAALQVATAAVRQLISDARSLSPESQGFAVALAAMQKALAALQANDHGDFGGADADDPIKALSDNLRDLAAAMDRAATSTNPEDALPIAKQTAASLDRVLKAVAFIVNATADKAMAQELKAGGVALGAATVGIVQQLQNAASKAREAAVQAGLVEAAERVTEAIQKLRDLVPGQRECDAAVLSAHSALATLDNAILAQAAGVFPKGNVPLHSAQERLIQVLLTLTTAATGIQQTVSRPLQMVPSVAVLGGGSADLGATAQALAAASDPSAQQDRLARAKNVAARSLAVAKAARTCRNDSSPQLRSTLANVSKELSEDIKRMLAALQDEVSGLRLCDEATVAIKGASDSLNAPVVVTGGSYQEARVAIELQTKALISSVAAGLLDGAKNGNTHQLAVAVQTLGQATADLTNKLRKAAAVTADSQVRAKLVETGRDFTVKANELVSAAKAFLEAPKNEEIRSQLSAAFQTVAASTSTVMSVAREGATGEIDCTAAIAETRDVTSALDEAVLFSATGGLQANVDPKRNLHFYYKGLQDDLSALGSISEKIGTKLSIEELGAVSRRVAKLAASMRDNGVACAYLVESLPAQQAMLAETRSVAGALLGLLTEARDNQLAGANPPAAAATLKAKLQALQSVVSKEAGAQLVRLTEIDNAEKKLRNGLTVLETDAQAGNTQASAEDIVRAIRVVVASYTVVSNETADDAARLKAVKDLGQASEELLVNTKGAMRLTTDKDLRRQLTGGGKKLGNDLLTLLSQTAGIDDTSESLKAVQSDIADLVANVRRLPGGEDLSLEENDLERQAEQELQRAAQQIQEAAERIANAREGIKTDDAYKGMSLADQDIATAILDAAKAIARATGVLVIAATASQKELLVKGKANKALNPYRKDPAWANGYISSAKTVSATIEELVQVANDAAKKKVGNEHLVAASRAVAGATARFVYASKVKSDPSAPSTQKLEEASKATAAATLALVNAAKEASRRADEAAFKVELDASKDQAQQLRKMEFELQVEIATLEKELEDARRRLGELRKNEYLKDSQPMTINRSAGEGQGRSAGSLRRQVQKQQLDEAAKAAVPPQSSYVAPPSPASAAGRGASPMGRPGAGDREARAEALAAKLASQAQSGMAPPPAGKLPPPK